MTVRELQAKLELADPDAEVVLVVENRPGPTMSAIARETSVDGENSRKHHRIWIRADKALDRARGE